MVASSTSFINIPIELSIILFDLQPNMGLQLMPGGSPRCGWNPGRLPNSLAPRETIGADPFRPVATAVSLLVSFLKVKVWIAGHCFSCWRKKQIFNNRERSRQHKKGYFSENGYRKVVFTQVLQSATLTAGRGLVIYDITTPSLAGLSSRSAIPAL